MRARRGTGIVEIVVVVVAVAILAWFIYLWTRPTDVGQAAPPATWAAPVAAAAPSPAPSTDPEVPAGGIATLVDTTWASSVAASTGIPERAVLAYAGASLVKAASTPGCRLSWTTLAAIGDVESSHGRHGGSSIGADGTVTPPIYGVALNGNGTALIRDSDGGAIDGDATADRAVGPMQLIPQTWRNWHIDGNADGVQDPQNIDDAVMATANYLCRASSALDTEVGWRAAVAAYNPAPSYLLKVARVAVGYNTAAARR